MSQCASFYPLKILRDAKHQRKLLLLYIGKTKFTVQLIIIIIIIVIIIIIIIIVIIIIIIIIIITKPNIHIKQLTSLTQLNCITGPKSVGRYQV